MALIHLFLALCLMAAPALAQSVTLRGQVTDESAAVVPGAKVVLTGPGGLSKTATAANDGSYSLADLPPGNYTVHASAPGLVLRQPAKLGLKSGTQTLNLLLNVAAEKQEVTVGENGAPSVSTEAAANASAVVLQGSDLDALSDNPDDLLADLQALAGPSAGPNGDLTISMQIRNLTNHNNPGPIIGNITVATFRTGQSARWVGWRVFSESANNRRLELQTRLTF
jgi:hypothetical protein